MRGPTGAFGAQDTALDRSRKLFAATAFAPCTGWPRTVMRGELRKGNSGHNSVPISLPDARNRAPVTPFRCTSSMCQRKKKVWGVKRDETILGVLSPFIRQETPAIPLPPRRSFLESFIKALPEQRPCAPATESASRSFAARFLPRVPVRRSTAPPCARW